MEQLGLENFEQQHVDQVQGLLQRYFLDAVTEAFAEWPFGAHHVEFGHVAHPLPVEGQQD